MFELAAVEYVVGSVDVVVQCSSPCKASPFVSQAFRCTLIQYEVLEETMWVEEK